MSIRTEFRGERNTTILKKVASILDHAEFDTDVTIVIKVPKGEVPTIRYDITENIVPDMLFEKENDNG